MTSNRSVSVVIPVFNAQRTLSASIQSVLDQTYSDWELLLVDDRSSDASRQIIADFAQRDPRIKEISLDCNQGAAEARNVGVRAAKGRFLAFLDSDDLWLPQKLEKQVHALAESPIAISFTDYEWIDSIGRPLGVVVRAQDEPTWSDLTWGNNIGLSTTMIDREKIHEPYMLPLRLNHDFALWLELLRKGFRARRMDEILVLYRMHPGSLSQNKLESIQWNWRILHKIEKISRIGTLVRLFVWGCRTSARRVKPRLEALGSAK